LCEKTRILTYFILSSNVGSKYESMSANGTIIRISAGKELRGQMSKCLKFCSGIEILNRFSLKNERL